MLDRLQRSLVRSALPVAFCVFAAGCSSSGDVVADDAASPDSTEAVSSGDSDVADAPDAEPSPVAGGEPACTHIGLSSLDWMLVETTMTNDSGELMDGNLNWSLYDGETLLIEGREILSRLEPGESIRFFRNSQTEIPAGAGDIRCEVTGFEPGFGVPPAYDESAGGGCVPTGVNDNTGTVEVDVTAINQLGTAAELTIDFVVYDPDGVRVGYNNRIVTELQNPGDVVEFSSDSRAVLPDGLAVSDLTCKIIALDEW